jgi:hypothetical protein
MRWDSCMFGVLALLLSPMALPATGQGAEHPRGAVDILRVAESVIEIQIQHGEDYPVNIAVSDKAQRLNALGYQWEAFTDKGWSVLTPKPPEGAVFGDVPPQFLEVGVGQTAMVRVDFSAQLWSVKSGTKLRIVVKTWHNEPMKGATEGHIASSPFFWTEPTTNH